MPQSTCLIRAGCACALLAAVLLLSACGYFGNPLEKARAAFDKGDFATARIEVASALQSNEHDGEAHLLLGAILDAQGDLVTSAKSLRKAAELGIERTRVDPLLARVLVKMSAYKEILDEFDPTRGHQGEALALVLAIRAQAQLALREIDRAKTSLTEAAKHAPKLPEVLIGQAQLAYMEKEPDKATALIDQAIAGSPRHTQAWQMKAALLQLADKRDEAIRAYAELSKLDSSNPAPELAAAELLMNAARFEEAATHIKRVRAWMPEYLPARHVEALWHFRQRQYDKALEVAQAARKSAPGFAPLIQLIAMTHLARGNPNQAEEELRALARANPRDGTLLKLYARTLIGQGKGKAALDALGPALAKRADDPALLTLAADAHAAAREFSKATELLQRAVNLQPADTTTLARLGALRLAAGDSAEGVRTLEAAVAADKDSISADFVLTLTLIGRREFAKALAIAQAMQAKQPKNPIALNLAGLVQVALNDRAAARQSFERALALDPGYWPAASSLARLDIAAGRADLAQRSIEDFTAKAPGHVDALYALLSLTGDRGRFVTALEAARSNDAKALAPRLALARSYVASDLGEQAIAPAREAAAIAPANADALEALGSAQFAAGKLSEALQTFRRLATEQPNLVLAHTRLAQTQVALKDANQAEASFKKALTLRAHDIEATEGIAKLYARGGKHAEAISLADALIAQWPKSGVGHALAGDLALAQKKAAEAAKRYEMAHALTPSGMLLIKRHGALVAAGQDPGNAMLEAWLTTHPRDAQVRLYLGNRHYLAGQFPAAAEQFRSIVMADPLHAYAQNNLANAYLKLKDARALATAKIAHELKPDDADILDTLGLALLRAGKAEQALELLKKALARNPDSIEINVHHALALAQTGEREAAREALRALEAKGEKPVLDAQARALLGGR